MQAVKLQSRGRLTLPAEVRRALGVAPGDQVEFHETKAGRVEVKATRRAGALADRTAVSRLDVALPKTRRQMELPI
jgi:AbrB family looped-hinge helix DNA binding protein